jgi:hypothetical protein
MVNFSYTRSNIVIAVSIDPVTLALFVSALKFLS